MTEAPTFSEAMSLFAAGSSDNAGPSALTTPTNISVSTTAHLAMTPGLMQSCTLLAHTDDSIIKIEEIAEQLANGMGDIDIGGIMNSEGDEGVESRGKGKEVMGPGAWGTIQDHRLRVEFFLLSALRCHAVVSDSTGRTDVDVARTPGSRADQNVG